MRITDIIEKKRDGHMISQEEINFFVRGAVDGSIADYQTSALLMAIYLRGLSDVETVQLTIAMANSGNVEPLDSSVCDKHSTGGVADTTTLVLLPLIAAAGKRMKKMSGRGLGFTGGTTDKLASIPGIRTDIPKAETERIFASTGIAMSGQKEDLAPADKLFYALRDVTATVDSLPLIASSIMSKKLALGAGTILLDVKVGNGAFMKTPEEAEKLARLMVKIGNHAGRRTVAFLTDMREPLGVSVGNTLEVKAAIDVLRGGGDSRLRSLSLELANRLTGQSCAHLLTSGAALAAARALITAYGGNARVLEDYSLFKQPRYTKDIYAEKSGYIAAVEAQTVGRAACILGAGRVRKEDDIDPSAGVRLYCRIGDKVPCGTKLFTIYTDDDSKITEAQCLLQSAVSFSDTVPTSVPLIYQIIE